MVDFRSVLIGSLGLAGLGLVILQPDLGPEKPAISAHPPLALRWSNDLSALTPTLPSALPPAQSD